MYSNPQTVAFCEMLGIEKKINPTPVAGTAGRRGAEGRNGPAVDDRGAFPPLGGAAFPPLGATPPPGGAGRGGRWAGGARGVGAAPVARENRRVPTVTEDAFPPLDRATRARGRGRGRGRGRRLG